MPEYYKSKSMYNGDTIKIIRDSYHGIANYLESILLKLIKMFFTIGMGTIIYGGIASVSSGKSIEATKEYENPTVQIQLEDGRLVPVYCSPNVSQNEAAYAIMKAHPFATIKVDNTAEMQKNAKAPKKTSKNLEKSLKAQENGGHMLGNAPSSNDFLAQFGNGISNVVYYVGDKSIKYGSVDERLKNIKNIGDLAECFAFYPADFVLDSGRGIISVFYGIPKEALKRTAEANKGPLEFAGNYIVVLVGGIVEQVTQRPLETIAHGATWYAIGKAVHDANHHHNKVKGGGAPPKEEAPPDTPSAPGWEGPGGGAGQL
jgi:hypothetical protein